jgi:hypothetical protein
MCRDGSTTRIDHPVDPGDCPPKTLTLSNLSFRKYVGWRDLYPPEKAHLSSNHGGTWEKALWINGRRASLCEPAAIPQTLTFRSNAPNYSQNERFAPVIAHRRDRLRPAKAHLSVENAEIEVESPLFNPPANAHRREIAFQHIPSCSTGLAEQDVPVSSHRSISAGSRTRSRSFPWFLTYAPESVHRRLPSILT